MQSRYEVKCVCIPGQTDVTLLQSTAFLKMAIGTCSKAIWLLIFRLHKIYDRMTYAVIARSINKYGVMVWVCVHAFHVVVLVMFPSW
jgi:hypothetical protein